MHAPATIAPPTKAPPSALRTAALLTLFLLSLAWTESLHAQNMIALPAYASGYSGMVRGFWFTAPCNFRIVGVRVPTVNNSNAQSIQLVKMNDPVANWTWPNTSTNFTTLGYWSSVNTTTMIACNAQVNAGDIIGVVGQRGTTTEYTAAAAPFASTVNGLAISMARFGHQGNINGGVPAPNFWYEVGAYAIGRIEIYYSVSTAANDAGIASIDSPNNFCPGSLPVIVTLKNDGVNQISSCTINWTLNGVAQAPYSWAGLLDTLTPATRQTQVTLGTQTFNAGTVYTIRAWTSNPNGVADTANKNDTLQVSRASALGGSFTIGGSSPDYATFAAAINDLVAKGVCSAVTFNVRPGSYPEQISLPAIAGTSAVNTVTFQSESGNPTNTTLTFSSASSTAMHTVLMNGADFITFRNLTIEATGASYAQTLVFSNGSDYNTFEGCIIRTNPTTSTSTNICTIYSSASNDNYNTFRNNQILNGSYGTYWFGASSSSLEEGTIWERNRFAGAYYPYKLYTYYQSNAQYLYNTIENTSTYTAAYLMYLYYNYNTTQIVGNKLLGYNTSATSTNYGIYMYSSGNTNTPTTGPLIANNFITTAPNTTTNYGLYIYYQSYPRIFNNTVYNPSTYSSSCALRLYYSTNCYVKNNIFYCRSVAIPYFKYTASSTTVLQSDYNLLYTTGSYIGYHNNAAVANNLAAWQTATGMDAAAKSKTVDFASTNTGDLHLAGASQNDADLAGQLLADVPLDIDLDTRVIPYMGADEACYVLPAEMNYSLVDAQGNPKDYAEVPGTFYVQYYLNYPAGAMSLTVNLRFYDPYTNALVWTTSFNASKLAGQALSGIAAVSVPPTVPTGAFRVEVSFNTMNSCGAYIDFPMPATSILFVPQGATPCQVWPGDVNNNGVVNYGDRSALNAYIQNANLRATWIYGPRRYRPDAATNALTYYTWTAQASSPWATPDGCYMDVDGNGSVNGFDYIGIRVNWLRSHGAAPKDAPATLVPETFDMAQNYPNPFNPSTSLTLSVPEASTVRLVVTDMLGREVATLADGTMQAGVHTVAFDARALPSGRYLATVRMTGNASGLGFSKVVTMTLAK